MLKKKVEICKSSNCLVRTAVTNDNCFVRHLFIIQIELDCYFSNILQNNAVNYCWENIFFNITYNFYEERTLRGTTVANIVSYDATTDGVIVNARKLIQ